MWSVLERDITQIDYQGNLTYLEKAGKLKIASSPEAFLLLPKKKKYMDDSIQSSENEV